MYPFVLTPSEPRRYGTRPILWHRRLEPDSGVPRRTQCGSPQGTLASQHSAIVVFVFGRVLAGVKCLLGVKGINLSHSSRVFGVLKENADDQSKQKAVSPRHRQCS